MASHNVRAHDNRDDRQRIADNLRRIVFAFDWRIRSSTRRPSVRQKLDVSDTLLQLIEAACRAKEAYSVDRRLNAARAAVQKP